jgi:hypothetical protein
MVFLERRKGELLVTEIAKLTIDTALNTEIPRLDDRSDNIVDLEPVDVLIPATVEGMLDHGTVIAGPRGIVGVNIGTTPGNEWIVDEVQDINEFEQFDQRLELAAIKIQRFYRQRLVRSRFVSIMDEAFKSLRAQGYVRSESDLGTEINTESGCSIM